MIVRRTDVGNHPLVAYDWNDRTGLAILTYSDGKTEARLQPLTPSCGWGDKPGGFGSAYYIDWRTSNAEVGERVEAHVDPWDPYDADGEPVYRWQYL